MPKMSGQIFISYRRDDASYPAGRLYDRLLAHSLGTCRQSARHEDGVCNKWGQAHDIKNLFISDGSQFTTGAAANPTLTIVALAIRQGDYIADQMAKQTI
jgi:choline dehydrogenase-like flavoprotein